MDDYSAFDDLLKKRRENRREKKKNIFDDDFGKNFFDDFNRDFKFEEHNDNKKDKRGNGLWDDDLDLDRRKRRERKKSPAEDLFKRDSDWNKVRQNTAEKKEDDFWARFNKDFSLDKDKDGRNDWKKREDPYNFRKKPEEKRDKDPYDDWKNNNNDKNEDPLKYDWRKTADDKPRKKFGDCDGDHWNRDFGAVRKSSSENDDNDDSWRKLYNLDDKTPKRSPSAGRRPQIRKKSDQDPPKKKIMEPNEADEVPMATWHKEPLKFGAQDYDQIKADLLNANGLFEDPKFEASNKQLVNKVTRTFMSYGGPLSADTKIEWLRPKEICALQNPPTEPRFMVENVDRFDVKQGELGNCWFLAALTNLAENKKRFRRVVPRRQKFSTEYAGIFRFRFWKLGEWIEVVVDDRLPTRDGKLIYLRASEPNEFWSALMEKAYAKLHGSYRALEGGSTLEAAVDFTGGIPEVMDLTVEGRNQEQIFQIMNAATKKGAFMCSSVGEAAVHVAESWGLHTGHAFDITNVVQLRNGTRLIRIRNPHGNDSEWKGEWCDGHRNWDTVSQIERDSLGLTFDHDGEFYMSLDDFLSFYGDLEICHLDPESKFATSKSVVAGHKPHKEFEQWMFRGQWRRGVSAGGCGNDGMRYFAQNPQYFFQLTDPDPHDDEDKCPVVISLQQLARRRKNVLSIGFKVYKCNDGDERERLDEEYFKRNHAVAKTDSFINARDVTKRMRLEPGRYCVVPAAFKMGDQADFLLRIFIERLWGSGEEDTNETKPDQQLDEVLARQESLV